jgi:uncharacterized repeat protein (TIGR01451 family)
MDMSNATARSGSLNGRIGLVALLASMCLVVAAFFGASSAKASTIGDPVAVDFNHVGINVTAVGLGGVNEIVLKPSSALGELELRGTYTSTDGDFTIPKTGGLTFPNIVLDLSGVELNAQIELVEDATGNYDAATGAMSLNPKISLTLGISDLSAIPIPIGTGALGCRLSPIDVSLSTANGWPAAGDTFDSSSPIKGGSVSGAWTVKPNIVATVGAQETCDLVGGLLDTVGGLWLAQSDTEIDTLPAATGPKPPPAVCGEGFTGEPPNCVEIPKPAAKVAVAKPKAVAIKRGKSGTVKVVVRNTGGQTATGVKVCGTIPAKIAKAPRCVTLGSINAGSSKTASLKLTVSRKAKGKGTLKVKVTSTAGGSASTSVTVTVRR